MSTTLLDNETIVTTSIEEGDHDRFAHYFSKKALELVFLEGASATAICGAVTVPLRDVKKYPVCPTCKEVYDRMGK
jgi:hypothetical protein